jgi:NAD+ synthase (glutamine-hydrolysing)
MQLIHVAAAVLNQTPLDWGHNEANVRAAIEAARAAGATALCLPELCLTGYGCEDAFHANDTHRRAWAALERLRPATDGLVVSFGLPVLHQNGLFNCAALVADGRLLGLVAKRFLAGDGIHYEPRWFKPWPAGIADTAGGVPIGDLHFDVGGVRIGFEICEDAWVANRPGADLARHGVDVIFNPSASHFAFGKLEVRKRFVLEGSRAFGVSYVYANLLGNEAGRAIYDGGALVASGGRLLAAGPRFSFRDCDLASAVVDIDATRMSQARTASFQPALATHHPLRITADFNWPKLGTGAVPSRPPGPIPASPLVWVPGTTATNPGTRPMNERSTGDHQPSTSQPSTSSWEAGPHIKEEEFTRAVTLALFDYVRKSRAQGCVVSLSGGADSSAVACLVALGLGRAWQELGPDGFRARLQHVPEMAGAGDLRTITGRLLTTVYQASENSGPVTRHAARAVAEALGATHCELDISDLHRGYVRLAEQALGRALDWTRDDIALQNIQARVRSPAVWMIANVRNALLLCTSNRSEAAVGYATMDGDTSGGLCPIAGIDKAYLRHWLRWLESTGPAGLHPIPALAAVNVQQPTAELRPPDQGQTDEADLMPYPVLDAIERAAIRDKRAPSEVFDLLRPQFPEHARADLILWIERFFRLWSRNQWKRERYAPSFHLDDENLDPKTWCRWPILSGGFEAELAELRGLTLNSAL